MGNYAQLGIDDVINLHWSILQVQIRFKTTEETKTIQWSRATWQKYQETNSVKRASAINPDTFKAMLQNKWINK